MSVAVEHRDGLHDRDIADRYMPLVRRIAMRTARSLPANISIDDVLSAGWVGMAEALKRRKSGMDEEHFEAYASHRVRGAILDYLRGLDPLSRKLRGASRRITRAVADLSIRLGRNPGEDEIAAELGLPLSEYQHLLTEISEAGYARLELSGDESGDDPSPETAAARSEMIQSVMRAIEELPERLQLVLGLYYQEDCSFREIGEVLGVTESRVCQIHTEAVHLIRASIQRSGSGLKPR
jgi:RNA polymerase sigma factor for flagellar operon FliA